MLNPSFASRLASGSLVAKRYRLTRQIGEGAMGAVWAAVDEVTTREVALKLLLRPDPEHRHRLLREARACGSLKHKNIIDVFDIMETETGEPFLVMQLLSGETVAEVLARKRRLDPTEAAAIGRDVSRALSAAHALQIIHRDLKPANIFLHHEPDIEGYVVKVLDFGIAKNLGVSDGLHTVAGGAVGSPFYMSPEQVRGDPTIDFRADIWALGVVLFEMITGVRPFQGETPEVFAKILTGEIPSVTRYVRRIDDRLAQLISRCLSRERDHRYASAAEVSAALEPLLQAAPAGPPFAPTVPALQGIPAPQPSSPALMTPHQPLTSGPQMPAVATPLPGLSPPGLSPPGLSPRPSPVATPPPGLGIPQARASSPGLLYSEPEDEDEAPTTFYKADEYQPDNAHGSSPALPQGGPSTVRWGETPQQPAGPSLDATAALETPFPEAPAWARGGTVKMSTEDMGRYRLPQASASVITSAPPAPPPPPGMMSSQGSIGPGGYIPPTYGAPYGGPQGGPMGSPLGQFGDEPNAQPHHPQGQPGGTPSSSVSPLMASGISPLVRDEGSTFTPLKLSKSMIALLVGLILALGIIGISLIIVLNDPSDDPASGTPEAGSALPETPLPGTTAAVPPGPPPEPPPEPPPPTPSAAQDTPPTPTGAAPKEAAPAVPVQTAKPQPTTQAATPRPTATATTTRTPTTTTTKKNCSKLKLLERQRCERGG
ncbi:serine/threonine-protein kinase [Chondromyces apiculatus]|uniref:Serine/threonine protein kinase n=1 Tax=Chondromyces apiculatus DSM 436 TaxID=1192034 RepID=A0A017SU89_9BACT|nr:serine/threonine-protein kinase [Chondromyces apiculatus]EYF00352.1 serine/threonine protein kinase [Chondromyces apiculatus DSM 436]